MTSHDHTTADDTIRPPDSSGGLSPIANTRPPVAADGEMRPEVTARLEWLDDLMFAAIAADPAALDQVTDAWRKIVEELGAETVEESRRQYLRHARSVWEELRQQPERPTDQVFAAIEIISLLADKTR